MNTVAFAEEAPVEEATVEAEASDAEIAEAPAEDEVAAPEAAVDAIDAATTTEYVDRETGLRYKETTGSADPADDKKEVLTEITYESDGDKKNPVASVVTMKNVTNPVSWNNFFSRDLIETAIYGTNKDDGYLNNGQVIGVSENSNKDIPLAVPGLRGAKEGRMYDVLTVNEADGIYLLMAYELDDEYNKVTEEYDAYARYVAGFSDPIVVDAWGRKESYRLPLTDFDGRKIVWNKSGKYKSTAGNREALDVAATVVKFEGNADCGTLTEYNGASVASVKVSKGAEKASVTYATKGVDYTYNDVDPKDDNKYKDNEKKTYVYEHDIIGALPTFTMTVKVKNKDFNQYKKDLNNVLKESTSVWAFGVMQQGIIVTDPTGNDAFNSRYAEVDLNTGASNHWGMKTLKADDYDGLKDDKGEFSAQLADFEVFDKFYTASSNDITKDVKDAVGDVVYEGIEKAVGEYYMSGSGYAGNVDGDEKSASILKVSKFKDGKATVQREVDTWNGKKEGKATITLKVDKDYTLNNKGTLAGEDVYYLDFPENGNYVYAKDVPTGATISDLSGFGYKWAFRTTPATETNKKPKTFRRGIFAETNIGFVYEQ